MHTHRIAKLPAAVMLVILTTAAFLLAGGYLGLLPTAWAAPSKKPYGVGKAIYYETGANSFIMTVDPAWSVFKVHQVEVHLNAASSNVDLTFAKDSGLGTGFDTSFTPIAMSGLLDATWRPDPPVVCGPDDTFVVSLPNTNVLTWGVQVYIEGVFE